MRWMILLGKKLSASPLNLTLEEGKAQISWDLLVKPARMSVNLCGWVHRGLLTTEWEPFWVKRLQVLWDGHRVGEWPSSDREPVKSGGLAVSMVHLTRAVQSEKVWRMALGSLIKTLPVLELSSSACLAAGWWDSEVTRLWGATTVRCSAVVVPAGFVLKFCILLLVDPLGRAHVPGPESSADKGQSNYRDKDFQKLNAFVFFPKPRVVQEEPVHPGCPPRAAAMTAVWSLSFCLSPWPNSALGGGLDSRPPVSPGTGQATSEAGMWSEAKACAWEASCWRGWPGWDVAGGKTTGRKAELRTSCTAFQSREPDCILSEAVRQHVPQL